MSRVIVSPYSMTAQHTTSSSLPVAVLSLTMFLVPAVGVPSELVLQDTLKSAIVAFGVLIAALVFFWQKRNNSEPLLWHGMVWLPIVLMLYALGSMVWSHTYLAGVEAIRWFLLGLLMWLGLNTLTRENLPTVLWGVHAGAVVASIWVGLQFWFGLGWFPQGAFPASTFVNRNFYAEYAVCVLPFSVWLLANHRNSRLLGPMALSLAFNIVALMMTGTRSALVALVLISPILVFVLIRYRQQFAFLLWSRANQLLVLITVLAGVALMGSVPSDNPQIVREGVGTTALERSFVRTSSLATPKEYTEGSFSVRSAMWKSTARMMIANPWSGVGAGAWEVQIPLHQRDDTMLETDYYAHNEFLQLLSEYGAVVGGLTLAVLMAYLLHSAGTTWRLQGSDRSEAPLRALTLTSLLAMLLVSNAGFPWHLAATGALFVLGLAILAASDGRVCGQSTFFISKLNWRHVHSAAATIVATCALSLASYLTWRATLAEYKLVHAIQIANRLKISQPGTDPLWNSRKSDMLQSIRDGVAANPHYRKLTAELAEPLSAGEDWNHAVWILESLVVSRPNVTALWSGLALGNSQLGRHDQANSALLHLQRLKPDAVATRAMEIILLSRAGHTTQATHKLTDSFNQGTFNYDMVQLAYAVGYQTQNWELAIRSQHLRLANWPQHAADAYFRLGKLYAEPQVNASSKAISAFRSGFHIVPSEEMENYRSQVPLAYQAHLE